MAEFKYSAIKNDGSRAAGTVTAADKPAATQLLIKRGLKPLSLNESKGKKFSLNMNIGTPKVKLKDKVVFTRQLATMINAGVPLTRSLTTLSQQSDSKGLLLILPEIVKSIESGVTLGDSIAIYPKVFDPVFVNMVKAGESAGILDQILERLAIQQEKDAEVRGKLKSALTYPMVVMSITAVAFIYLMTSVVPQIGQIITDLSGEDYKPAFYTVILLAISHVLVNYGLMLGIGTVVGVFALRMFFKSKRGAPIKDGILLRIPVLGMVIAKVALARFARIFSSLSAAGVSVLEALRITGQAMGNKVLEKILMDAALEVQNGKPLSEPLSKEKFFPPVVAQMIAVGEETGEIEKILLKLAGFYEREVDEVADSLTAILEPIMIVILGSVVGVIALSVFGPISQISQSI